MELAGVATDEEAPNERTQRVDLESIEEPAPAAERNDSGDAIEAPAPQDRTRRFAMSDATTPDTGSSAVEARHNRTQLFAMHEPTPPGAPALEEPLDLNATLPPNAGLALELTSTLPPDAEPLASADPVSTLYDPADPPSEAAAAQVPFAATMSNIPHLDEPDAAPMPLELPEPSRGEVVTQSGPAVNADDLAAIRAARSGGAGRLVVVILALVALVLAAILVYRLFPGLFAGGQPPVGLVPQSVQSVALG